MLKPVSMNIFSSFIPPMPITIVASTRPDIVFILENLNLMSENEIPKRIKLEAVTGFMATLLGKTAQSSEIFNIHPANTIAAMQITAMDRYRDHWVNFDCRGRSAGSRIESICSNL
jgi:hypothetical protein